MFHDFKYTDLSSYSVRSTRSSAFCFLAVYTFIFLLTYLPHLTNLPQGYHQWAQSDRLAIAMRYAEGKPLSTPATYSLKSTDGDVGVELSLGQYLISLPFKAGLSTKFLPAFYKIFTFTLLYSSLFFLVFGMLKKENLIVKTATLLLLYSSPMLMHYGFSYIPDVWALGIVLLTLYLFHTDFEKHIYLILLLCGLAAFTKTSSGIYLCAFYGVYFLQKISKPNLKLLGTSVLFIALIASIGLYDYFRVIEVNKELWSYVFMSQTNPINSWDELVYAIDTSWRFKKHYLSTPQRWFILAIGLYALVRIRRYSLNNKHTQLCILLIVGMIAIFLFFGVQFMNHDYYIIATILPGLFYFILFHLRRLTEFIHPRSSFIILLVLCIVSFNQANKKYFERMSELVHIDGYTEPYPFKWLLPLSSILDSVDSTNAPIFITYVPEPNHSLLYAKRRGATFSEKDMNEPKSLMLTYLSFIKPKLIVVPSEKDKLFRKSFTALLSDLTPVYNDDSFIIYQVNGY